MNNTYLKKAFNVILLIILLPINLLVALEKRNLVYQSERKHLIALLLILGFLIFTILTSEGVTEVKTWRGTLIIPEAKASEELQFGAELQTKLMGKNKWDTTAPYLKNGSWRQQKVIMDAWEISNHDREFVLMLAGENGLFTPDRKSDVPGEDSWGFCQMHRAWHSKTVDDPRFFSDPYWQLQQCYKKWVGGTRFYGYDSKWITITKFKL